MHALTRVCLISLACVQGIQAKPVASESWVDKIQLRGNLQWNYYKQDETYPSEWLDTTGKWLRWDQINLFLDAQLNDQVDVTLHTFADNTVFDVAGPGDGPGGPGGDEESAASGPNVDLREAYLTVHNQGPWRLQLGKMLLPFGQVSVDASTKMVQDYTQYMTTLRDAGAVLSYEQSQWAVKAFIYQDPQTEDSDTAVNKLGLHASYHGTKNGIDYQIDASTVNDARTVVPSLSIRDIYSNPAAYDISLSLHRGHWGFTEELLTFDTMLDPPRPDAGDWADWYSTGEEVPATTKVWHSRIDYHTLLKGHATDLRFIYEDLLKETWDTKKYYSARMDIQLLDHVKFNLSCSQWNTKILLWDDLGDNYTTAINHNTEYLAGFTLDF